MPPSDGSGGGARKPCASCGRAVDPGKACPHCGAKPANRAAELAELDKELSEMAATNVELDKQRKALASKMQAAKHQRDVLARTLAGQPSGTRRPAPADRRRRGVPGPPRRPHGQPPAPRPALRAAPTIAPLPAEKPEASSRSVQAIMLALGALLLAVAAMAFVGVAITTLDAWGLLAIIAGVCVLALGIAPALARRGLTSTGEAAAAVGLLLVAVAGYALWTTETVVAAPQLYAGLVAGVTVAIGYGYHRLTGLVVPRYGALVALQFVLPLWAYPVVAGPVGWAVVFTLVATHNAGFGHVDRRRTGATPALSWPPYLAWVLHGLALGVAAGYATTALALADTVPVAITSGAALVAAAAVGVIGTLSLRRRPLPDVAAGLMTLALMVAAARVALVAAPDAALLPVAAVVAAAGLTSRMLPTGARRGPQLTSTAALAVLGTYLAVQVTRAIAGVLVLPPWPAATPTSAAVVPAGWQLAAAAATLTIAAVVALPPGIRREGATAGAAVTALAAPASFALPAAASAWVLVAAAAGLGLAGMEALQRRAAFVHLVAAGAVGLVAAGASLATPALTSGILAALTVTGAVLAFGPVRSPPAAIMAQWAGGGGALALPGATATGAAALGAGTSGILAAASAGVCVSLAYPVRVLLARRIAPVPITMGAAAAAVICAGATIAVGDATAPDYAISGLLVLAAVLAYATPRIDATRRRDRLFDGADLAAAAVAAGVVATLARITWLVLPDPGPDGALAIAAALVAGVALAARALPPQWRRGPLLGVGMFGALVAGLAATAAGYAALASLRALSGGDLSRWPPDASLAGLGWAPPAALALLAATAAVVLPRSGPGARRLRASAVSAALAVAAVVGLAPALGLPWWGPAAASAVAATGYALSAVGAGPWRPADPRAARARAVAAATLACYAAGASLARPWATAAVLGLIALIGVLAAARTVTLPQPAADPRLPIGGGALAIALLATPGTLAAYAAHLEHPGDVRFLAALAGAGLGLAAVAALRAPLRPLLGYATVGVATGATLVALMSVPTAYPTGVYAAAAALLAVLAELVRAERRGAGGATGAPRLEVRGRFGPRLAGWITPAIGALLAAAVPIVVAVIGMLPALRAALVDPHQVLADPWAGPPAALLHTGGVPATNALAALLLTLASALAAVGFGGAVTRQTAPVIAPGLAVTLLITPPALGLPWPAGTTAGLAVFTFAMLGVALTAPPPRGARTRVLRINRILVLGIGLAAGGAGLAGSLADQHLTWGTLGGAVAVGATAALWGRTRLGRLTGWLGAAIAAQFFALVGAALVDANRHQAGWSLLAVAAVALLVAAPLPRLRRAAGRPERVVVEWFGGYLSLAAAAGLALGSPVDLAAVLFGAGLVLGTTALRPEHSDRLRRVLLWVGAGCEVGAVWIVMWMIGVRTLEAYTVPLALFALLVGALEVSRRPGLSSWIVYGPGLSAALAPSLVTVVFAAAANPVRQGWVLVGGTAALLFGSRSRQRAPVIIGAVVTAAGALHLLSLAGPYLVLIPIALLLFYLGGKSERRQRDLEQIRGALDRMR